MSGVSATSSSTSGVLGDAPPVTFPGVASGIDYNSIIQKYTAETLQQEQPLKTQAININAQNTAILKIKNLIGSVQDSLTALSDPTIFGAYKATPGNTASGSPAATLKQIPHQSAIAGTVAINAQTAATATTIVNNPAANGTLNATVALDTAGTSITATNGPSANGSITINGTQVSYDVTTQSLTTILNNIKTQTGVNYSINANGTVTLGVIAGVGTAVSTLGSGADSGNLEQVLKLDTAPIVGGNVTSSSSAGGINETSNLNQNSNAGFATAVTAGTFTINGVAFTVNPATDSLSNVITRINASSAGVTAQYNSATSQITLTSTTPGPQSILVGKGSDTSNFLSATGLTTGTTTSGTQASVTYTDNTGTHVAYSSTDDFANVVPGFTLTVTNSSPALPPGSTYYTVSVASDPSQAETAINKFVTSYNTAIRELNKDLVAPTVTTGTGSTGTSTSASSGGGSLYGNFQISNLRDQLVQLVSGIIPSGSTAYNSLASVGLKLNTASQTVGTASDSSDSSDATDSTNTVTVQGSTDGTLAPLDTAAFEAAYAANTAAVQSLFTLVPPKAGALAAQGATATVPTGFAYTFGSYLANANGLTTFLANSAITPQNLSSVLLSVVLDSNNQQIDSIDKQVASITKEANNQANQLRAQFTASESQIAQLQSLQSEIAAIGH